MEQMMIQSMVNIQLDSFKKRERELRIEILEDMFPNAVNTSIKLDIGDDTIIGSFGLIYSLDTEILDMMYDDLSPEEKDCITYAPKFSVSKYKKLSDTKMIDALLTTKPSLPTLKIEKNV